MKPNFAEIAGLLMCVLLGSPFPRTPEQATYWLFFFLAPGTFRQLDNFRICLQEGQCIMLAVGELLTFVLVVVEWLKSKST